MVHDNYGFGGEVGKVAGLILSIETASHCDLNPVLMWNEYKSALVKTCGFPPVIYYGFFLQRESTGWVS